MATSSKVDCHNVNNAYVDFRHCEHSDKFQVALEALPMKKTLTISLMMLSFSVFADPIIFGMELGITTEKELKSMYDVSNMGTNKYSNGNMYSVPLSSVNFDGLEEITTIFNTDGKLVAVLTSFHRNKFNYLNKILSGKYRLVSQQPSLLHREVTYRDGATEIKLVMTGFDMTMSYIRDDLIQDFTRKSQEEARQKQESEASQL